MPKKKTTPPAAVAAPPKIDPFSMTDDQIRLQIARENLALSGRQRTAGGRSSGCRGEAQGDHA